MSVIISVMFNIEINIENIIGFMRTYLFGDHCTEPNPCTRWATELDSFRGYWRYRSFRIIVVE